MLFDDKGRCNTGLTKHEVNHVSRYYFNLDKNGESLEKIYDRTLKSFNLKIGISFDEFKSKIEELNNKINNNEYRNINKGFSYPFIIPKIKSEDIGSNIEEYFFPALKSSYEKMFPDYSFNNQFKGTLKNNLDIWKNSRYQNLLNKLKENDVVGLFFPCMSEFSFPAAIETLNSIPEDFVLSGGYEIFSALVGNPKLLMRKDKYPPLLWLSSLYCKNDDNLAFHIEPYGYNLTFNQRAHLNKAAEYWWHSISLID